MFKIEFYNDEESTIAWITYEVIKVTKTEAVTKIKHLNLSFVMKIDMQINKIISRKAEDTSDTLGNCFMWDKD